MRAPGLVRVVAVVAASAAMAAALGALRRLDVAQVRGRSMQPSLRPGDRLLIVPRSRPPRVGEVVLVRDPRDGGRELVKRVAAVGPFGVVLRGDNAAASTDGRAFGAVPAHAVRWRVAFRVWPPARVGPIPRRLPSDAIEEGGEPPCTAPEALVGEPAAHEAA